jgi:hypothetical protein
MEALCCSVERVYANDKKQKQINLKFKKLNCNCAGQKCLLELAETSVQKVNDSGTEDERREDGEQTGDSGQILGSEFVQFAKLMIDVEKAQASNDRDDVDRVGMFVLKCNGRRVCDQRAFGRGIREEKRLKVNVENLRRNKRWPAMHRSDKCP